MARSERKPTTSTESPATSLGLGWTLTVDGAPPESRVRIAHPRDPRVIEFVISLTDQGPVVRGSSARLEFEAEEIVHKCRSFAVEATDKVEIRSHADLHVEADAKASVGGAETTIFADAGDVQVRANDDVRLKGEMVLLNCERPAPPPDWVHAPLEAIPVEAASGSPGLLAATKKA